MATDPTLTALGQVEVFSGLNNKELRGLRAEMKELSFPAGTAVVEEGDREGRFYLIVEGTAVVKVNGRTRRRLGPGDHFGEISLIDREPRSATVIAQSPLRTLSLANFNFRALVKQTPDMSYKLLVSLCRLLRAEQAIHL